MKKCAKLHEADRDVFTIVPNVDLTTHCSHNEAHFVDNTSSLLVQGNLPVASLPLFNPPLDIKVTFGDRGFGPGDFDQLLAAVDGGPMRGLRHLDLREVTLGGIPFSNVQVGQAGNAQLRASIKNAPALAPLHCKVRPAHTLVAAP